MSPQETVPWGLPCLGLGPTARSSGEDTRVEEACGPEGQGQGLRASGCSDAVPPPREKVAKAGPDQWEAWEQTQWSFHGDTAAQDQVGTGEGRNGQCLVWTGGNKR